MVENIDKLMKKLKSKKKDEKEKKEETNEKVKDEKNEAVESEDTNEEQEQKPIPATSTDTSEVIEHEVAVLQNDGIFRRELILTLKELIDVHKVNTQALLDLKGLLEGNNDKGK